MGEAAMREEELEIIGAYVRKHIGDWMKDTSSLSLPTEGIQGPNPIDRMFGEKLVRLEEAIKHQGDLLEKMLHQMDKRFEQVDKRFEQVDKRFEQVDKRFEDLRGDMNKRFSQLFIFLTVGIGTLGTLVSLYQFLG